MKKTFIVMIMVVLASIILSTPAVAQTPLKSLVEEGQMQWLAGRWKATTDEGDIELAYRWGLEGNAILVSFKMGDYSYQGMIFAVPGEEAVNEVGIDSKGTVHKCQWDINWDGAVCMREATKTDGEKESMGMVASKAGGKKMTMKLYGVEWGSLKSDPFATLEFTRQPRAKAAKAKK